MSNCRVIVFAKAPASGQVKTRLAAEIGEAAAARLAARMLRATLAQAVASQVGPVELCGAPDIDDPLLRAHVDAFSTFGVTLSAQGDGELGVRMERACRRVLATGDSVILIGTDAPALNEQDLRAAADALRQHPAVFTPALDGGYVLIGLSRHHPSLFHDIAWGTDSVMESTRARLRALRWTWHEFPPQPDIDVAADLIHLTPDWLT
jgi:rSAM/selenodomain-associated transferase 1